MAIKKAIFKTSAFFKGFLLPLAEDATAREAVIIGSILAKMSINNLDSAAALMKLLEMPYLVGRGYFIKTILAKRYARILPAAFVLSHPDGALPVYMHVAAVQKLVSLEGVCGRHFLLLRWYDILCSCHSWSFQQDTPVALHTPDFQLPFEPTTIV